MPDDAVYIHRFLQIDLHAVTLARYPERHLHQACNAARREFRAYLDRVMGDIPPAAFRVDAAPQTVSPREGMGLRNDFCI